MKFYQRNEHVINHKINVNFEDLLEMTPDEFTEWVVEMRKVIKYSWDTYGCPPRIGKDEDKIVENWNLMESFPVHTFVHSDELSDGSNDVILNKSRVGSEVDQFFDNMFKTRINYTDKDSGYSIYDLVANDDFLDKVCKGSARHFRRDSFYSHAPSALKHNKKYSIVDVSDGVEWIEAFFQNKIVFLGYDFFLEEVKIKDGLNTGYHQLEHSDILQLTSDQVLNYRDKGWLKYRHHSTFDIENVSDQNMYSIRMYKKGKKIFPSGFKSFRIGYIQPAVNFPPGTAKYLYERYTQHIKEDRKIKIYDPSSGWGGRILGAMSCRDDRSIHYIGTDPNPDNFFSDGTSRYSDVADFYNTKTYRGNSFFSETNTYEVYQLGSEVIHEDENFKEHKGSIDVVFTSPPYFNREAYSEDEAQSYKKYGSSYLSWRDGFLVPTLNTCCEWLRPGGYLLWNIADILIKGSYLTLEEDSVKIIESNGLIFIDKLKMALEGMPGQNRIGEDGKPKCKNFCSINGRYLKYEPIYVFRKEN
jgi:DNA modification methylase